MADADNSTHRAPRTGISVLKKFFGLQPGQDLKGFAAEAKHLTDTDFNQLKAGIENGTFTY